MSGIPARSGLCLARSRPASCGHAGLAANVHAASAECWWSPGIDLTHLCQLLRISDPKIRVPPSRQSSRCWRRPET